MVIVSDDCALPGKGIVGRRGIAGTVFVHKVRACQQLIGPCSCILLLCCLCGPPCSCW